ncbi:histidine acid [Moniliophthora roreri]|nr:histidine acid [Moniliophthora roreri]
MVTSTLLWKLSSQRTIGRWNLGRIVQTFNNISGSFTIQTSLEQ